MSYDSYKISMKKSKERIKSGILDKADLILSSYLTTGFISEIDLKTILQWYEEDTDFLSNKKYPPSYDDKEILFNVIMFFYNNKKYGNNIKNVMIDESNLYTKITGLTPTSCGCGNKKTFKNFFLGFSGPCSIKCIDISNKRKKTNMEKYGVDNPFKLDEIQDKIKKTNIEKYGVDNPSKSQEVIDKITNTCIERYGVKSTLLCDETIEKIKKTNIEKYGTDNIMKSQSFRRRNKSILIEKYGVDNPFKLDEIQDKIKKTNIEKYGVDNPSKSQEVIDKITMSHKKQYGGVFYNQKHLGIEIVDNLNDEKWLTEQLKNKTPMTLSEELGCSISTVGNYIRKMNVPYYRGRSSYEDDLANILDSYNVSYYRNIKKIIEGELDFYIPEYNLAIEINGLYWHSDIFKDKNYHLNKYNLCKEKGIRLISINEDEWKYKKDIVTSKILSIIGISNKGLPARKLSVKEITSKQGNNFCEQYHIQGKTSAVIYSVGAYYNLELIGVMLFSKQRTTGDIELIRFCHDGDVHNGLFSKLLKYSLSAQKSWNKIISFADLRYSEGNLYEKTGFVKEKVIDPDYVYVKDDKTYHKSNFTKSKIMTKFSLTHEYMKTKTELELMKDMNYNRMYDIGKIKYIFSISDNISCSNNMD